MSLTCYSPCIDNNRSVKRVFNTKPVRTREIGRPKLRWEDDVIQDRLRERRIGGI
jgi:hypothetical protein